MKMQESKFLVLAAVGDQAVPILCQLEFAYQILNRAEQVAYENLVFSRQRFERLDPAPGYQDDMKWISWPGVIKSQQVICFTQVLKREGKIHVLEQPGQDGATGTRP